MNRFFKLASLLSAAVMLFAACGETGDGTGNDDITPGGGSAENNELTLEVDNQIIQAGVGQSKLTVKFGGKVLTDEVIIFDSNNKVVDLGADFIFTSDVAGSYSFWANYKTYNSNTISITVVNTPVPETPEDPQPSNTSFVRRVLLTKFTGEQCPACPNATASIHKFMDEHELAPDVVKAEAHTYSTDDPAYFSGSFYSVTSFPSLCVDWILLSTNPYYQNLESMITERYEATTAKAGISVNSICADDAITFKVSVKAAQTGQYRVGAWLLEDNIKGQQQGAPAGEENSWYNDFDDCIRIADSKTGTSYSGLKLGVIEAGNTAEKMFTWTLNPAWKVENLKLCVFVSEPDEKGYSYIVNNAIYAPVNGVTPFEYAK